MQTLVLLFKAGAYSFVSLMIMSFALSCAEVFYESKRLNDWMYRAAWAALYCGGVTAVTAFTLVLLSL